MKESGTATGNWSQGVGTGGTITTEYDTGRRSDVIKLNSGGRFDMSFGGTYPTERAISFWYKHGLYNPGVVCWISTSSGNRRIAMSFASGTDTYDSGATEYKVYLGTTYNDGNWHRIERDLQAIISTLTPGVTLTNTYWLSVWTSRCWIDDIRFSNSLTVEHNTLAPGAIGHIARHRTYSTSGYTMAKTDRWFHSDQVGSVIMTTDSNGTISTLHHPDAFGNRMTDWQTGLWVDTYAQQDGWGHNTKEFDANAGLFYTYQRWYDSTLGTFASQAPYPPMIEHQYGYAFANPVLAADSDGMYPWSLIPGNKNIKPRERVTLDGMWFQNRRELALYCYALAGFYSYATKEPGGDLSDPLPNAIRHCVWQCCLTQKLGPTVAIQLGDDHEGTDTGHDHDVDVINNRIGRGLGADRECDRGCFEKCADAWSRNRLAE